MEYASNIYIYSSNQIQNLTPNLSTKRDDFFFENKFKLLDDLESSKSSRKINFNDDLSLKDFLSGQSNVNSNNSQSSLPATCPLIPPNLTGPVKLLTEAISIDELESLHPELEMGGHYKPPKCKAVQKVAVVIPYRNREEHLKKFLHNIHPFLQKQQAEYVIYVVEQNGDYKFNRAKLFNVGFVEAMKQYDFDCFIFHDVDLIPEDDRNIYRCSEQPRHLSVAINTMKYRLPYADIFGGVSALSKKQILKVNGFSNKYWGWGGEDDDLATRIKHSGYRITRYKPNIARYTMLTHNKETPNPERYKTLYRAKFRIKTDGINSLNYDRLDLIYKKLYTWILVDLKPPN